MNKTVRQTRKFLFYLNNLLQFSVLPRSYFHRQLSDYLGQLKPENRAAIFDRVDYYNRLSKPFAVSDQAINCGALRLGTKNTYVFDLYRTLRYFDPKVKVDYLFGDVRIVPEIPKFVKSRPIHGENSNSILLKLNEIRHFYFVKNDIPFEAKKPMAVWRGALGKKTARIQLLDRHGKNPRCDIGCSKTRRANDPHLKGFLTIREQLQHKFVLSIEGNDVATNLKWILSSNSLCLMPKPKFETWFMEGRLKAGIHYAEIREDYADLDEKMDYYLENPDEALQIIRNANQYVETFKNQKQEQLILLLVMLKYFHLSGQLSEPDLFQLT